MEQLESLIRTLTYRRSRMEIILKTLSSELNSTEYSKIKGIITGISIAITEIYKLIEQKGKDYDTRNGD